MCATLAASVCEFTLPMYSSMSLGLFPAAWTRAGAAIRVGKRTSEWAILAGGKRSRTPQIRTCRKLQYTGILTVSLRRFMTARDEFDPLAPQREAAFFYGLFLRGHDIETLRQDIDVPRSMMDKWMRAQDFEASFRDNLQRVYAYRKQVLAIFDGLVSNDHLRPRLQ